ncbi:hypothetical protein [Singulisphaera sp. PoT]|uniref:hypothetical protein n=1 Tax=Singulisphaera sp. PoT TaxID=3411797 RepID=UPI003BF60C48
MAFPDLTTRRSSPKIGDLMVLVAIAALPLAGSQPTDALPTFGFSATLVLLGGLLWWLPIQGGRWKLGAMLLPAFMALAMLYLFMAILAFAWAPKAAALMIFSQLITLIYVSFRV